MPTQSIMAGISYGQITPLEWLMPRGYIRQVLAFHSSDRLVGIKLREGLDGVIKDVPYLLCGVVSDGVVRGSVSLT